MSHDQRQRERTRAREPRPRLRATYNGTGGVRHLFAAHDLGRDRLYGHVKPRTTRIRFLEFLPVRAQSPPARGAHGDRLRQPSLHLTTKRDQRVGAWAEANNVEIAYAPTNSSWRNRIVAHFTARRYFALDGTDQRTHQEQGSMIRRYIAWRNRHIEDQQLRGIVTRANAA